MFKELTGKVKNQDRLKQYLTFDLCRSTFNNQSYYFLVFHLHAVLDFLFYFLIFYFGFRILPLTLDSLSCVLVKVMEREEVEPFM